MIRQVGRAILAIATATGVSVGVGAGVASAGDFSCDAGEYCAWQHSFQGGGIYSTAGSDGNYWSDSRGYRDMLVRYWDPWNNVYLNDNISSWRNAGFNSGPTVVHSYRDAYGGGGELWRGGLNAGANYVGDWADNKASSHYWAYS